MAHRALAAALAALHLLGSAARAPPEPGPGRQDVAACVAVKDQHRDIREWVQHHLDLGVRTFYVFDHGSRPPMDAVLADFVSQGSVHYRAFTAECEPAKKCWPQLHIYQTCLDQFRAKHQWMLFLDADEFIAFTDPAQRLDTFLARFSDAGALALNWQLLGTSGLLEAPAAGARVSFTACLPRDHPENKHVKIIANLRFTSASGLTPHEFVYEAGRGAVNEAGEPVVGPRSARVSVNEVALYHYVLKSAAEYAAKRKRGSAMGNHKAASYLNAVDSQATAQCGLLAERAAQLPSHDTRRIAAALSLHLPPAKAG